MEIKDQDGGAPTCSMYTWWCSVDIPEPPFGKAPGADPLHAALQVKQSCDGLFQTLFIFFFLTLLLQLLWKQGGQAAGIKSWMKAQTLHTGFRTADRSSVLFWQSMIGLGLDLVEGVRELVHRRNSKNCQNHNQNQREEQFDLQRLQQQD